MFEFDPSWGISGESTADTPIFNDLQRLVDFYDRSGDAYDRVEVDLLDQVPSPRPDPLAEFHNDPLAAPVPSQAYVEIPSPSRSVDRLAAERMSNSTTPTSAESSPFPMSVLSGPALSMVRPWEVDGRPEQTGRHHRPISAVPST